VRELTRTRVLASLAATLLVALPGQGPARAQTGAVPAAPAGPGGAPVQTVPGMLPVPDPANLYSEAGAGKLAPASL